jgi:hypothetical protein
VLVSYSPSYARELCTFCAQMLLYLKPSVIISTRLYRVFFFFFFFCGGCGGGGC